MPVIHASGYTREMEIEAESLAQLNAERVQHGASHDALLDLHIFINELIQDGVADFVFSDMIRRYYDGFCHYAGGIEN